MLDVGKISTGCSIVMLWLRGGREDLNTLHEWAIEVIGMNLWNENLKTDEMNEKFHFVSGS